MLFIGHFSFDELDAGVRQKHGYFSSIVDAETPDDAVAKFETHIRATKENRSEMADVVNVYIEEILRIENIPDTPLMTRFQSSEGIFPPSVSYALPGVESRQVDAFGYTPDVEKHGASDQGDFVESQPFITFGR